MRQFKLLGSALAAALLVAACGGGGNGNQSTALTYTSVVSFGDSLSDAGSYGPGLINAKRIASTADGGMFTVNGIAGNIGDATPPSYTWAQLIAAQAVGKPNCAARTGGFGLGATAVANCTNYAQGGSRVTATDGTGNKGMTGSVFNAAMTIPVITQIAYYLSDLNNGGKFTGTELVTVLAGANDILAQTDKLKADAAAAGSVEFVKSLIKQFSALTTDTAKQTSVATAIANAINGLTDKTAIVLAAADATATTLGDLSIKTSTVYGPIATQATADATAAGAKYASTTGAANAVQGMITAANELVGYVKTMVTTQGAKHVVVATLPDVSQTPHTLSTITYNSDGTIKDNSSQQLVLAMTTAFNNTLDAGLKTTPGVQMVYVFEEHQREIKDPAHFALTNVKDTACDSSNAYARVNPADASTFSSLVCNAKTLIAGDTTHYMFADDLHPTPYEHKLLAQYVSKTLVTAGWF